MSSRGGSPAGRGGAPAAIFAAGESLDVQPRLADAELNALTQAFRALRASAPEMPLRPGWGTAGTPGRVRTNFFAVRMPRDATYYEYEIAINPAAMSKRADRRARVMELVERAPAFAPYVPHIAHDRSQRLVSARALPQPLEVEITYSEEDGEVDPKPMKFTVEMKYLGEIRTSTLERCV